MIADAVIGLLSALISGIGTLLDALVPGVPAWVATSLEKAGQVTGYLYQLDTWIPVGFAFNVAAAVIAAYLVGLIIGIVRVVASYLTLGGGAT